MSQPEHLLTTRYVILKVGIVVVTIIKGPDNPTCVFFRKSVAVDTIGSLSKGTSECASVSQ